MNYKKDFWYIVGLICTLISIAVMTVTFILMYFGNNVAIILFLAGCPLLFIGLYLMPTVRKRYETALLLDEEPVPMFWHIRYAFAVTRLFIAEKGLARFIFIAATAISLIVTIVFGYLFIDNVNGRNIILDNIYYNENNSAYQTYYTLWENARNNGDEENEKIYFKEMSTFHAANEGYRKELYNYEKEIDDYALKTTISGAVTLVLGSVFVGYLLYIKRLNKQAATE